jgi:DNA-binding GntR family transcriptional regulator
MTGKLDNVSYMAITNIGPIDTASRKDRVSEVLRQAIVSGKFRPGDRIVEMQVSKDLGVGNTAVREALFDLESKGFVTRVPNKGTFVTQLTAEDVEQIFDARREMEGLAVELLEKRVTDADVELLQKFVDGMREAVLAENLLDLYNCDMQFHSTIWRLSGNRFLANALGPMVFPLFAFFNMNCPPDSRDALLRSVEQHADVVRALRSRTGSRAAMEGALAHFRRKKLRLLFQAQPRELTESDRG